MERTKNVDRTGEMWYIMTRTRKDESNVQVTAPATGTERRVRDEISWKRPGGSRDGKFRGNERTGTQN
jgi:hypothetical protein